MNKVKLIFTYILIFLFFVSFAYTQSLDEGIKEYQAGNYEKADQLLRDSLTGNNLALDAKIFYYIGLTNYKLKNYPNARDAFLLAQRYDSTYSFMEDTSGNKENNFYKLLNDVNTNINNAVSKDTIPMESETTENEAPDTLAYQKQEKPSFDITILLYIALAVFLALVLAVLIIYIIRLRTKRKSDFLEIGVNSDIGFQLQELCEQIEDAKNIAYLNNDEKAQMLLNEVEDTYFSVNEKFNKMLHNMIKPSPETLKRELTALYKKLKLIHGNIQS